jgi:phosphatidylinositol alpha 1,6-mannosyltransferase
MVGIGPMEAALRAQIPENVQLYGWLTRERLRELYATTSGFLHPAEEDFGMTMVEALASGSPVIALDAGGARDIVRDGVDGILISEATIDAIRDAVERVATRSWDPASLVSRSRLFSINRFSSQMRSTLTDAMADED